jgi:SP family arabinose:H+ symporter-like MFS transporter
MHIEPVVSLSSPDTAAIIPATINKRFIALVSGVAALGGLLFGFDTAIISGTIPYITAYFALDAWGLGWSVSSILIGCAIGALVAGKLADLFGRRIILVACALLFAISGLGTGLAFYHTAFIFFRVLGGIGVGAAAMVSPMYIAEMAPAAWRGRLVAFYQLAIVSGILLAYFSNYLFDGTGNDNWRWMFMSQLAPSLLFLFLLVLVPETPRWLMKKGHKEQAQDLLIKINGRMAASEALHAIEDSFRKEPVSSLRQVFSRSYGPVLLIGIMIAVFQQVTGINAVLYYAPVIFQETGLNSTSSLLQTIGIGVVNMVSTFIAILFVDRAGRKAFLVGGSLVMGFSLIALALCFYFRYFDHYLVLIFMLLYVGAFGCTLGAVTWVYLSEIFPNQVRALALSVATLALWLADFLVTWAFPVMVKQLGTAVTLACYAGMCALAFVYMLLKVKETRGKTLEEVEGLWQ